MRARAPCSKWSTLMRLAQVSGRPWSSTPSSRTSCGVRSRHLGGRRHASPVGRSNGRGRVCQLCVRLYPKAIAHHAESGGVPARTLQIFTFMGKFIAKAMIDCRLVDLPFAPTLYRQMLGQELSIADVDELRPHIGRNLRRLRELARKRTLILESGGEPAQVAKRLDALQLDGCDVANLGLNFTLPGQPEMELKPGGSDIDVTSTTLASTCSAAWTSWSKACTRRSLRSAGSTRWSQSGPWPRSAPTNSTPSSTALVSVGRSRRSSSIFALITGIPGRPTLSAGCSRSCASSAMPWRQLPQVCDRLSPGARRQARELDAATTIVRKNPEEGVSPDAYLPSVMTCANYVKLLLLVEGRFAHPARHRNQRRPGCVLPVVKRRFARAWVGERGGGGAGAERTDLRVVGRQIGWRESHETRGQVTSRRDYGGRR